MDADSHRCDEKLTEGTEHTETFIKKHLSLVCFRKVTEVFYRK